MLCRLAGSRVFPPLESLGEQQPLRESLVILSGQGPCEQKPSLANRRFHTLAPGFLEGFSVRHISICAVNAVVPDDPQKELVVRRPELPIVSVTRGPCIYIYIMYKYLAKTNDTVSANGLGVSIQDNGNATLARQPL